LRQIGCPISSTNARLVVNSRTLGIAHITPTPNVHSPSSSSDYRPISVFQVLSKLFEKGPTE